MKTSYFIRDINPIIIKELRSRMRGGRAFATLTGALVLLSLFSYAIFRVSMVAMSSSGTPLSPQIGQAVFTGLVFFELIMISAIAPAITSGAISGEKEKQTYEMLLATPLNPSKILWGKLISALSYVLLLIFAAIPMFSLVFIFGGVAVREIVKALLMLVVVAVMFGVLGLFFSALLGRTGRATALTYVVIMMMLFAPLFISGLSGMMRQSEPVRWMLAPSPISALASALSPSVDPQILSNAYWILGSFSWIWGTPTISYTNIPRPLYHYSVPLFLIITLFCYLMSTRFILPARRWRFQWAEILIALVFIIGLVGIIAAGYSLTTNRYENIITQTTPTPIPSNLPLKLP